MDSRVKTVLRLLSVSYTLGEFFCIFSIIYLGILVWLLFTPYFYFTIIYFVWMLYDRDAYKKGRLQMWFRRLSIWKYAAEYFPLKLHKTVDLDPNENYIIGYHPHGITATAPLLNFMTEATDFSKKFPGITCRGISLNLHFLLPIHRELISFLGICSNHKESIDWALTKYGKGTAVAIVIGGAEEAMYAMPNTMNLTLKNRKGFVKLALKHGVSLIPCISFGDNEIYSHIMPSEDSLFRKIQMKFLKPCTLTIPLFYGRGFTENSFGFLPYKKTINTIVGSPIKVKKIENPTIEDIENLHAIYLKSLMELFYSNRSKFAEDPNIELKFR